MDNSVLIAFGQQLKDLRNQKQISQEELAFLANLDRTYISGIENGKRNISLKALYAISLALKVSLSELFMGLDINL